MRKYYCKLNDYYSAAKPYLKLSFDGFHLFDGTLSFKPYGSSATDPAIPYPALLPANEPLTYTDALVDYWATYWGEQRVGFAIDKCDKTNELNRVAINKIQPIILNFWKTNYIKYQKLVETLCYKYNPIENYNSVEQKTITPGTDTFQRTIDKAGQDTFVNAPHVTASVEGTDFNDNTKSGAYLKATSVDTDGKNIKTETKDETTSTKPNSTNGYGTEHYTTTYDDSSNTRLAAIDKTIGQLDVDTKTNNDGNKVEEQLTPSAGSSTHRGEEFTDKTTHGNTTESLNRKGNIGVTTSQQMIESERELADFNVVKMFFEELNHYIMLQIWN